MNSSWPELAFAISQKFDVFIIPVTSKSKPAIKWINFEQDDPDNKKPTKDLSIMEHWAKRFTSYAIIAGPDLLILDIDVKEKQNGKASLKYMREHGLSIDTFAVKTPSGGLHLFYNTPAHYTPKQGANLKVLFEEEETREGWDALQKDWESTGIDIRHKNGYVLGAGSVTSKGEYTLVQDKELADIPIGIQIGRAGGVKVKNVKTPRDVSSTLGISIPKGYRDQAMLSFTMGLARKNLPNDFAKALIVERLKDCYDEDGEAPTIEDTWSKYTRALDKVDDIIDQLLLHRVYITQNQRVINTQSGATDRLEDLKRELENRPIAMDYMGKDGESKVKMENPVDVWMKDVDRKDVREIVFDPRFPNGVVTLTQHDGYIAGNYYNQFKPIDVEEKPYSAIGEKIFDAVIRVFKNVLTDEYDYKWFCKWLGMTIFEPSFRPAWHFHIFGTTRGSGKTTLTKIVKALCGESNCRDLDVDSFDKSFNLELFSCYMAFMNDFTSVSNNSAASTKLNTAFKRITGTDGYTKQAKYVESIQSPIFIRFIFTSNDGRDFPVDEGDRRLFKCESKGEKLDHETLILAHGIIGVHGSSKSEKRGIGADIQIADVEYARYRLYDFLSKCGYLDMRDNRDCPDNEVKEDFIGLNRIGYLNTVEQYIDHKAFIFASDIITKQTLQIFLDQQGIKTKVESVISELVSRDIIQKMPVTVKKTGKPKTQQIDLPMLSYDEDMDMIETLGGSTKRYLVYVCRNFDHWMNVTATRRAKPEQSKIIHIRNLSKHNFSKPTTKVVPLIPDTK